MPGSGKTYISERVASQLKRKGIPVSDRAASLSQASFMSRVPFKIAMVLRCILGNPSLACTAISVVMAYKPDGIRKSLKLIYNWLYLCALIRTESGRHDVVVSDQGLGQALWSTLFHGQGRPDDKPHERLVIAIMDSLGPASVSIVHVHANDDLIERRLVERTNGRSPLDSDRLASWNRAVAVSYESGVILDRLSAILPNVRILDIDNNEDQFDDTALEALVGALDLE